MKNHFPQIIAEEIKASGLTQKEIAKKLHIAEGNITNWKKGENLPSVDVLIDLCVLLNVSADELLGLADYSENTSSSCDLDAVELEIIEKYRLLSEERKSLVLTEVNTLLEMDNKETL